MSVSGIFNKVPVSSDMRLSFEIPDELVSRLCLKPGDFMDVNFDISEGEIRIVKMAIDYFYAAQRMAAEAKKPCHELFGCCLHIDDISGEHCMRCYGNCQDAVERYNLKHNEP